MAKEFNGIKLLKRDNQHMKLKHIALVLMFAIASTLCIFVATPKAQSERSPIPTHAYLNVSPNPVGVDQEVTIIMWLTEFSPTAGPLGGRWTGYTILVTKPDGSIENLGPFAADPASYAYCTYTPNQIGTYTIKFSFPGQNVTGVNLFGIPVDDCYGASSFTTQLIVQQQPVTAFPQSPLPTDYWERPINAQNQEWYTISGNWLGLDAGFNMGNSNYNVSGNFNPYTTAPDSGHIVWTKALEFGGLIGGEFGGTSTSSYYTGKMYEAAFGPPIIINGVLYYNSPAPPRMGFYAVDLRTGETLWWQNSTGSPFNTRLLVGLWRYPGITLGQVYNYKTPNQIGGIPYLWSIPPPGVVDSNGAKIDWIMYDAVTGNQILRIANVTDEGTGGLAGANPVIEGPNGELLVYLLDGTNSWLAMWNSSLCIGTLGDIDPFPTASWCWRPQAGATLDWKKGVQWNVTTNAYPGQAITKINSGIILATTGSYAVKNDWQMEIGYNMTTGAQLWVQNRTLPLSTSWQVVGPIDNGIYTEFDAASMQWYGYDAYTGQKVWGPSEAYTNAWGCQPIGSDSAYGNLYGLSVDGVHAFNLANGQHLWDFYGDPSGLDFPGFNTYPFLNYAMTIADGKVFAATGTSYGDPLYRGARLYAINATSGKQVWSVNGFYYGTMPVADGYLVAFNGYDNQIYCFGKGPSRTTVTGPENVQPLGTPMLLKGTVTDQSPGDTCLGLPVAGTPAIADENMSEWMAYLYMQQPCPQNAEGVEVVLTTFDPNGNTYEIGRTTTSDRGTFGCEVELPVPGLYKITATFEGSDSYYGSSAETYVTVEEAPSAAQSIEPEPTTAAPTEPEPTELASTEAIQTEHEPAEAFALGTTEIAIIVAVAVAIAVVIGIVSYWALRKRQ